MPEMRRVVERQKAGSMRLTIAALILANVVLSGVLLTVVQPDKPTMMCPMKVNQRGTWWI